MLAETNRVKTELGHVAVQLDHYDKKYYVMVQSDNPTVLSPSQYEQLLAWAAMAADEYGSLIEADPTMAQSILEWLAERASQLEPIHG